MKKYNFKTYFHFILAVVIYLQVAFPKLILISIISLLILVIIGYKNQHLEFQIKKPLFFLICLYLAYLTGVFFTDNPSLAKLYLENKLSFVLFPLLFMFQTKFKFEIKYLIISFVIGVLQVGILGIFNSLKCDLSIYGTLGCFTSSNFSFIHHPTYFSIYILVALFASWYGYFFKWKYFTLTWILPITFIFLAFYALCLSLAGMLFLMLFIFFLVAKFVQRKFGKIYFLAFLIASPIILFLTFKNIPKFKVEFNNSIATLSNFFDNPQKFMRDHPNYHTGSEERVMMWTVTVFQIADHPFGVGTGNVDYFLQKELKENGQDLLAAKNYNPHNQFLQTTLEIGVFGLFILLGIFVFAFNTAVKEKNLILIVFLSAFVFNAMFESVLQLQSGIVFFSLWISILLLYLPTKQKENCVNLHK